MLQIGKNYQIKLLYDNTPKAKAPPSDDEIGSLCDILVSLGKGKVPPKSSTKKK